MSRLIDADALLREHCGALFYGEYASCEECQADGHICGLEIDAEDIKNAPTVDAEPVRHGHWVTQWNRYDKDGYVIQTIGRCSCCNQYSDVLDYCGNCGAKMDGEE